MGGANTATRQQQTVQSTRYPHTIWNVIRLVVFGGTDHDSIEPPGLPQHVDDGGVQQHFDTGLFKSRSRITAETPGTFGKFSQPIFALMLLFPR